MNDNVYVFIYLHHCLKGTYYAKINLYKVLEHSCVAAVCENNQKRIGNLWG